MQRFRFSTLLSLLSLLFFTVLSAAGIQAYFAPNAGSSSEPESASPLLFVENQGQFPAGVLYQVQSQQGTLWVAEDGLWWSLTEKDEREGWQVTSLHWQFPGASEQARIEPFGPVEMMMTYFTPAGLFAEVPVWSGVRYAGLYPGLDLEVSGVGGELTLHWQMAEGATPGEQAQPALHIRGASEPEVTGNSLSLMTAVGRRILPFPSAGQALQLRLSTDEGQEQRVTLGPKAPPPTAPQAPLTTMLYSTFMGGTSDDQGNGVLYHTDGFAYAYGEYLSVNDFPGRSAVGQRVPLHDIDSYIAKVNPAGNGFVYMFHIVASQEEAINGLVISPSGDAYAAGRTSSPDYPTTPGAYDTTQNGEGDAWVLKLNSSGSGVQFSTVLGSNLREWAHDIAIDGGGNIYVTGLTQSPGFPVTGNAFDNSHNGNWDAFLAIFNSTGSSLAYSTFIGSNQEDSGQKLVVDPGGNIFLTGYTYNLGGFPRTTQFGTGGSVDAWVARFAPGGVNPVYIAGLGGGGEDRGMDLAVDGAGRITVVGFTGSGDFPVTAGAYDTTPNGNLDAFVARLNAAGSGLEYATFLGGSNQDGALSVSLDAAGNTYFTGYTYSSNFPTTANAYDASPNGGQDIFVAKLSPSGSTLGYSSFVGGVVSDVGRGIAVEANNLVFVTGMSESPDFPVTAGAFDVIFNGGYDVVLFKLQMTELATPTATATAGPSPTPTATMPYNLDLPLVKYDQ